MDSIKTLIDERPVVIFTRSTCEMCHSIKTLICGFGANPTVYEVDQITNGHQIETALQQLGCEPSLPAVFIGQEFVGGDKQVMSLLVKNLQLGVLLKRAGAIWIWNDNK